MHSTEKIQPDDKDSMPQGDYAPPRTKVVHILYSNLSLLCSS